MLDAQLVYFINFDDVLFCSRVTCRVSAIPEGRDS